MFIYVYVIYVFNATVKLWVLSWIQKHHSVFLAPVGFHTLRLLDSLQLLSTRLNRILFASHLQVKGHHPKLRQVGVFLDMEEGQVSLYNVKSGSEIYSFHTSTEFTERMFPLLGTGDKEVPLILLTTLQHPAWGTGTRTGGSMLSELRAEELQVESNRPHVDLQTLQWDLKQQRMFVSFCPR